MVVNNLADGYNFGRRVKIQQYVIPWKFQSYDSIHRKIIYRLAFSPVALISTCVTAVVVCCGTATEQSLL